MADTNITENSFDDLRDEGYDVVHRKHYQWSNPMKTAIWIVSTVAAIILSIQLIPVTMKVMESVERPQRVERCVNYKLARQNIQDNITEMKEMLNLHSTATSEQANDLVQRFSTNQEKGIRAECEYET